jgi:hypothetical protein
METKGQVYGILNQGKLISIKKMNNTIEQGKTAAITSYILGIGYLLRCQ